MTAMIAIAVSSFLCGVALMYLVMTRTMRKRIAERALAA